MTVATTWVGTSGPAVRAALAEWAPNEVDEFENEFRAALSRAAVSLDLAEAQLVVDRWRGTAVIRANPLSAEEEELVQRVLAGDESAIASLPPDPRG